MADLTMDKRTSWSRRYRTTLPVESSNIIVQSDGGLREDDCAAAAWIVGVWGEAGGEFVFEPLVAHGTYLQLPCTVFKAEAIALDEASRELSTLLTV